jgi:predicted nucleic-acid-binding Zn-ribbon protein
MKKMPLTPAQIQKVENWLTSKKLNPTCPSCGGRKWTPLDIISANTVTAKGTTIGGNSIPMVQIVCSNCGFVKLFAAVPMGLP